MVAGQAETADDAGAAEADDDAFQSEQNVVGAQNPVFAAMLIHE